MAVVRHADGSLADACRCDARTDDDGAVAGVGREGEASHARAFGNCEFCQHVAVHFRAVIACVPLFVGYGVAGCTHVAGRGCEFAFQGEHGEVSQVAAAASAVLVCHEAGILFEVGRRELHHAMRICGTRADITGSQAVGRSRADECVDKAGIVRRGMG